MFVGGMGACGKIFFFVLENALFSKYIIFNYHDLRNNCWVGLRSCDLLPTFHVLSSVGVYLVVSYRLYTGVGVLLASQGSSDP
jgi:hypothetical protein